MKIASKQIIVLSFILTGLFARQWVETGTSRPSEPVWDVNSISDRHLEISFDMGGYFLEQLPNGKNRITFPGSVPILESGAPELPRMARSIIIPDLAHMELSVLETEFIDVPVENIEPSKGNLTRDIDPSTIPYTYGKSYQTDEWYPSNFVFMREPYIMRSLRGQTVVLQPIQYNPIQRTLRIYTHIKISILENGLSQNNPLTRRPANGGSREFEHMYKDHFINYPTDDRYDVLGEQGPMLIISYGDFMDEMQTFVDWKNYKGIPTEMVDIADIGDVDDMAQLVEDQYYENGIAFVLLVGDIDQIETIRRSDGAGSNSPSDNSLTFVAGNDFYPDLIIGRFSAETGEQVETMINRTIEYEMDPDPAADWYKKGSGFASNQGPGDDGEYDDEHLDNIRELLLAYTYIEVDQIYDPDGTVAQGEAAINEGRSIVNYTGHGSNGSWGNGCPMNNTNVNGLVNTGMWPFIWSVACVNGEFNVGTCFAETWLRATDSDGNPTGAIATLMSTVNQAWNPPMEGQDEMNAIFVESYSDNIKRTFGGLSFNGMNQMNDSYGSQGYDETCYWTIFGDPSVVMRSDTPTGMEVTHSDVIIIGATEFNIETGESGALVSVSRDGDLLSSAYTDGSGAVDLFFETALDIPGPVDVVVTAYNRIPYETSVNVIAPDGAYMLLGDVTVNSGGDQILDYGEMGYFYTTFENVGQDPSGDLTFILSHEGSMVDIITEEIFQSSVAAGDEVTVGPFELQVSWNVEDGADVPFTIQAIDGAETWGYDVNMAVEAPAYNLVSAEFYDNGNGTLDPGESAILQLVIQNTGHAPVSYPTFEATTSDPYLTLGSIESDNAYWWDMNQQVTVTIEITASSDAPVGHTALAGLVIGALDTDYEFVYPVPITFGLMIEDFETGNFASFDWVHGGNADWVIDSDAYSGSFSAKSGDIGHDQTSELSIVMNILYEGDIQFWSKASSEQGESGTVYDYLDFYIDNDPQELMIGGTTDWVEYTVNLPAGEHTLRWVYEKDDAQSSGEDCAWVDRIYFPPGAIPPLNIDFGDLNFDSIVNVLDVIVTVNYIIGYIDLNNEQIQNADVNLDGSVDVFDILLIVDMALGN
ncbi:MAG: C25 family cysteine peptidase [Candidatus Marinimicrobia bacterium]|nr:C25 family cysteine peptidase [Candidatus Neomarinimicrobiota bacterium]